MPTSGSPGPDPSSAGPEEPPKTAWAFPSRARLAKVPPGVEVIGAGADLAPGTLLAGYRRGMFAMSDGLQLLWWSPDPRGVLTPDEVHFARSMHRVRNRLTASLDASFAQVLTSCADPRRPSGWITPEYMAGYLQLHQLGWAHSIEIWHGDRLVAGLFGVEVGGLFAAESQFHEPQWGASASRLAVIALCELLAGGSRLIDVQWCTPHLAQVGVREIPRSHYLLALPGLLARPPALWRRDVPGDHPGPHRIRWRSASDPTESPEIGVAPR